MKKILLLPVIFLCISLACLGQAPQAFKYQAVIRDTTGSVIADQLVSLKISIIKGNLDGEIVYSEIHDVYSNALGLVNLEIGRGLVIEGNFAQISWGEDSYFIRLEVDLAGGMTYQQLGTSQLLAVPYALYAETSGSGSEPDTVISQWNDCEEGIYYNEGHVGIGTSNPDFRLQIEGTSHQQEGRKFLLLKNNSTDEYSDVIIKMISGDESTSTDLTHMGSSYTPGNIYRGTTCLWNSGNGLILRTNPEGRFSFETLDPASRSVTEIMRITGDAKIGLGTENPEAKLQIESTSIEEAGRLFILVKNNSKDNFSTSDIKLEAGEGNSSTALTHHSDNYTIFGNNYASTSVLWNVGNGLVFRTDPGGRFSFETTDTDGKSFTEHVRMTGDGKFGIGTLDPQRTLHVNDVMRLEPRSTPPENPAEGDIYMDSSDHRLKVFDGTTWQSCW